MLCIRSPVAVTYSLTARDFDKPKINAPAFDSDILVSSLPQPFVIAVGEYYFFWTMDDGPGGFVVQNKM
jgi:hypothetical protein